MEKIDYSKSDANMYGCTPCPKCQQPYRYPWNDAKEGPTIRCDDCGHVVDRDVSNEGWPF